MEKHKLEDGENGLLLYLADRATKVGSSALNQALAAFQFGQDRPSERVLDLSRCIVAAKRRAETITRRPPPAAVSNDISKVWNLVKVESEPKMERDVLMVVLSWEALLRASEAAELLWDDLSRVGDLYKVRVGLLRNVKDITQF